MKMLKTTTVKSFELDVEQLDVIFEGLNRVWEQCDSEQGATARAIALMLQDGTVTITVTETKAE